MILFCRTEFRKAKIYIHLLRGRELPVLGFRRNFSALFCLSIDVRLPIIIVELLPLSNRIRKFLNPSLHLCLILVSFFSYMPSGIPYIAQGVIRIHFPSHLQIHLYLGGQCHKCVRPLMDMHWLVHSYDF